MGDSEAHYIYNGRLYLREGVRLLINAADSAISRRESTEVSSFGFSSMACFGKTQQLENMPYSLH